MCEVLSDVHLYNKFDLLPENPGPEKNIAITRFKFYLPVSEDTNTCDRDEPSKKKMKLCQGTSDKDGDLVLERSSGEYLKNSRSQYSSDDDTDDETEEIETNFDRDHLKNHHDDRELNVVTLRHSLATELNQVGEQVWLGALLLCDYLIYQGSQLREKTVVDLGSGTGFTSIIASLFAETVYCTDVGENVLDISKHNTDNQILLGGHTPCCIHVRELDWFKPIKASEEKKPYGFKPEDVSEIYKAQMIIASDVVYDDDITDAFINTVVSLMSKPPGKSLLIGLEKRLVFTIQDLDIASPGYDHFRRKLDELTTASDEKQICYRVTQINTDFPQYFQYNRTKELELWSVETIFENT